MCETSRQTTTAPKADKSDEPPRSVEDPARPKVCSCDKPCCRSKLIKQAATATGGDS